ncbi:MAG: enoyl-CoA hydratase/isomerase family protein [Polyangiaceae bacterium]
MMTELTALETTLEGGVLSVFLNRPAQRNAMSLTMVAELSETLKRAEGDPAVRVLVLRGRGGHFCAGGDIKDMAGARGGEPGDGVDPLVALSAAFGRVTEAFARCDKPVVAVLQGAVMGGGFGLSCVADVALADETARFGLPETSLGLLPAQIAPFLVERLGYAQAKRLAVTGARLDAKAAFAIGLVHEVVADEAALDAALDRTLEQILRCAPEATSATKRLLFRTRFERPEQLVDDAAVLFAKAARSEEGMEGMMAFVQKRAARWARGGESA